MNILDENVLVDQRHLLLSWRISFRQIGYDAGRKGMKDKEIIPYLLSIHQPTFFSLDQDFFRRNLCHARYCLIFLDVKQSEAALFIRRILRHPELKTQAKRMGTVIRVSHSRLVVWRLHAEREVFFDWVE